MFHVTFKLPDGTERTVEVSSAEHVLDAGLAAGLDLPYSCLQGWCLTCAARVEQGAMDQSDSRRYFEADRDAGFVLPCTGRALSNLVLVTHQRNAMRRNREQHRLPFPRGDWGTQGF